MKIHTLLAAACALFLLNVPAHAATVISDPLSFVKSVYAAVKSGKPVPEGINTARLQALYDLDRHEANGEVGRMDFDIWMNAQDGEIGAVKITAVPVENAADRRIVIAKFKNEGKPQEVRFYFEKTRAGWKLDDARSVLGETWMLSLVLKYGWDGQN